MDEVKPGMQTTEFAQAQSASVWGIVATVLGILLSTGAAVAEALGTDTKLGIVAGAVIAVAGVVQKTLSSLGYIKARADVKAAASAKPNQ